MDRKEILEKIEETKNEINKLRPKTKSKEKTKKMKLLKGVLQELETKLEEVKEEETKLEPIPEEETKVVNESIEIGYEKEEIEEDKDVDEVVKVNIKLNPDEGVSIEPIQEKKNVKRSSDKKTYHFIYNTPKGQRIPLHFKNGKTEYLRAGDMIDLTYEEYLCYKQWLVLKK